MFGDVELKTLQVKKNFSIGSSYEHASVVLSSTSSSLPFFPVPSNFYPIKKRMALAETFGRFLEDIIDRDYFEHYMDDCPQTKFCVIEKEASVYAVSFILCLIETMNDTFAIESILVAMLIYVERYFQAQSEDWLHRYNLERLLLCAAWLATKVLEDDAIDYKALLKLSGMTREGLNELEVTFLRGLGWNFYIQEEVHQIYSKVFTAYKPAVCIEDEADELRGLALV